MFFHPPRLLTRFFDAFMLALFVSCPVLFGLRSFFPAPVYYHAGEANGLRGIGGKSNFGS